MSSNRSNRSDRSNRFANLSNPHSTKSNSDSLQLNKLFNTDGSSNGNAQEVGAGAGQVSGPVRGKSGESVSSTGFEVPDAESSSSRSELSDDLEPSESRPTTVHDDPFPSLNIPSFEAKGPKDPNQKEGREKKVPPKHKAKPKGNKIKGFELKELFFTSKWPGVTWNKGVVNKGKDTEEKKEVIVRVIDDDKATPKFLNWMNNERWGMDELEHTYILKYLGWDYNEEGKNEQYAIFPKCDIDLWEKVRKTDEKPLEEEDVIVYMGQIAQALAYMHERNYVHTRIHPSSIRLNTKRNVKLSRLMRVQKYSDLETEFEGEIPDNAREFFFISPERFRQEIERDRVFEGNTAPELLNSEKERLLMNADVKWDPKADDVWAFGCTTFSLLTAKYPFSKEHSKPKALLEAFLEDFLPDRIDRYETMSEEAHGFLLWILVDQNDRPTMDQVVNHPWLQSENKTSPHNAPNLSKDPKVRGKSFKKIEGHIDDALVQQMADKGYSVQYLLGAGGFGAVYKGTWRDPDTGVVTPVALKIIKQSKKKKRMFKTHRWAAEYKVMTAFEHPNLVEIKAVFKEIKRPQHEFSREGRVFIFMELATMDLGQLRERKGSIPEPELKAIMMQVNEGLTFLHKHHIVHRDIKPPNILLCGKKREVAKLTDYSLVREADSHTISHSYTGTRPFMAPELHLKGLVEITDVFKVDVWALGITIFECLESHPPQWDPVRAAKKSTAENLQPFTAEYNRMIGQVTNCRKSEQVTHLMYWMLQMDIKARYSLKQVKNHSWFTGELDFSTSIETDDGGKDSDVSSRTDHVNLSGSVFPANSPKPKRSF